MKEVVISGMSASRSLEIKTAMNDAGHKQGIDYDFKYEKQEYDPITYHLKRDRQVTFMFYDERLASWFTQKYL
jgi:hypothetical protein